MNAVKIKEGLKTFGVSWLGRNVQSRPLKLCVRPGRELAEELKYDNSREMDMR